MKNSIFTRAISEPFLRCSLYSNAHERNFQKYDAVYRIQFERCVGRGNGTGTKNRYFIETRYFRLAVCNRLLFYSKKAFPDGCSLWILESALPRHLVKIWSLFAVLVNSRYVK